MPGQEATKALLEQLADPIRSNQALIDIGKRLPAFPVTPPYVRVRMRRFGGLSD
jgi:hypothetical protein